MPTNPEPRVLAILLRTANRGEVAFVEAAEAVAGTGLVGDRYATKWAHTKKAASDREVTLVSAEDLAAAEADKGLGLTHADTRRNVLVSGVRLDDLVGREFKVGGATLRGERPCVPCSHLEKTTKPGAVKALWGRGGLRASIVSGGTIRVGDAVSVG